MRSIFLCTQAHTPMPSLACQTSLANQMFSRRIFIQIKSNQNNDKAFLSIDCSINKHTNGIFLHILVYIIKEK
jgi:hypothetical protein